MVVKRGRFVIVIVLFIGIINQQRFVYEDNIFERRDYCSTSVWFVLSVILILTVLELIAKRFGLLFLRIVPIFILNKACFLFLFTFEIFSTISNCFCENSISLNHLLAFCVVVKYYKHETFLFLFFVHVDNQMFRYPTVSYLILSVLNKYARAPVLNNRIRFMQFTIFLIF